MPSPEVCLPNGIEGKKFLIKILTKINFELYMCNIYCIYIFQQLVLKYKFNDGLTQCLARGMGSIKIC